MQSINKHTAFLMELSKFEYENVKNNCIHVADVTFFKSTDTSPPTTITSFGRVDYGKNVNFSIDDKRNILKLDRCKRKIVLVTIDRLECDKSFQDVQVLDTRLRSASSGSGIVVLMMAVKATKISNKIRDKRVICWY